VESITLAIPKNAADKWAELARQKKVVRRRVATIESQAAVPMVTAKRYLDALEALAA
jgi:hypothetical protein